MKNGTSKKLVGMLIVAAALLLSQAAQAYVGLGFTWPGSKPRIPVYIGPQPTSWTFPNGGGTFNDAKTHIQTAINEWNTAGDSEFQFVYTGDTTTTAVADDGINTIQFVDAICPLGNGCKAVAYWYNTSGVYRGFDIVFYRYRAGGALVYWSAASGTYIAGYKTDVQTVAVHELGHALGLDHSQWAGKVMSTDCGNGCLRRTLLPDDISGIQNYYGLFSNDGLVASNLTPAPGTSFTLDLDYPLAAGKVYVVTMTLAGMDPFELNQISPTDGRNFWTSAALFPTESLPYIFQNFVGLLDANGQATATVNLPNIPGLSGFHMYFSVITLDPQFLSGFEDLGVAVDVAIQ